MPDLPLVLDDTELVAALVTAVKTAWTLTDAQVYVDVPESAPAGLPRAGISPVGEVSFDGQTSTLRAGSPVYTFEISGAFTKPGSGPTRTARQTKANLLLAQLTAAPRLSGYHWIPQSVVVDFGEAATQAAEAKDGYYSLRVRITFED